MLLMTHLVHSHLGPRFGFVISIEVFPTRVGEGGRRLVRTGSTRERLGTMVSAFRDRWVVGGWVCFVCVCVVGLIEL